LVRRCLHGILDELRFDAPLRSRGAVARGSSLHDSTTLRRLLTWALPEMTPDLAIVLVDEDGQPNRRTVLRQHVDGRRLAHPPVAIGTAAPEFEAWLIADHTAVRNVLGIRFDTPPEELAPRQAKTLLNGWISESHRNADDFAARLELAAKCDLDNVASRSRSFRAFRDELRALVRRHG
jgi:hypothetical protein